MAGIIQYLPHFYPFSGLDIQLYCVEMKSLLSLFIAITVGFSPALVCGQNTASQDQDDVIRVRSNEVQLDIVVKDKKGRPVKDLKAADFEVFEDGVSQKVESFRFITRVPPQATSESKSAAPSSAATPPPVKRSTPAVTALVFDRLSPEARALARKAGLAYAQEGMASGGFTGVFGIDQSLRTFQTFTDDALLIKDAVEHATSAATSSSGADAAKVRSNIERSANLDQQMTTAASQAAAAGAARDSAAASEAGAAGGQAMLTQQFVEMQTRMLEAYERLERDQEGHATINSLLAVISPMQKLPGRKTIIFFSEGLKLPPNVQQKFPAVINAANRANVSIYSIDAAGLRIESGTAEAAREINSIAAARLEQQARR
jgi:VWFA-related protein